MICGFLRFDLPIKFGLRGFMKRILFASGAQNPHISVNEFNDGIQPRGLLPGWFQDHGRVELGQSEAK